MKQKPDIPGQKSLAHGQYRYIESFISLGSKEQVQRIPRETYSILASPPDSLRDSSRVPPPLACVPGARKGKEERKIGRRVLMFALFTKGVHTVEFVGTKPFAFVRFHSNL